jgi:hypothetical protein
VDRGKQGIKRSVMVDAEGTPLGVVAAPANRHDSPLLGETLARVDGSIELPEQARAFTSTAPTTQTSPECFWKTVDWWA